MNKLNVKINAMWKSLIEKENTKSNQTNEDTIQKTAQNTCNILQGSVVNKQNKKRFNT